MGSRWPARLHVDGKRIGEEAGRRRRDLPDLVRPLRRQLMTGLLSNWSSVHKRGRQPVFSVRRRRLVSIFFLFLPSCQWWGLVGSVFFLVLVPGPAVAEILPSDPVPPPEAGLLAVVDAPILPPAEVEAFVSAGQQLVEAGQSPDLQPLSLFERYLTVAPAQCLIRFAVETRTHRKFVDDFQSVSAMEDFFKVFLVGDPAVDTLIFIREVITAEGNYVMGKYFNPPVVRSSYVLEIL